MNDTPEYIKQLQLAIWLSKTPAQRLRQFMEDNDAMYRFWDYMKEAQLNTKTGGINSSGKSFPVFPKDGLSDGEE